MFIPKNIEQYDYTIIAFSGGKDSLASMLAAMVAGAPNIELWHHDVDGQEGSKFMDWPCTRDYCRKVAKAFKVPIYYSWKIGGFEGEMLREDSLTMPVRFETPDGVFEAGGVRGNLSTRRKFPQKSADLSVRWCSAYLKISVGDIALNNQPRFWGKKILFVTGERAEESPKRATYSQFEVHGTDSRGSNRQTSKLVDHWRPVHQFSEAEVWELIKVNGVVPHPAYRLGWGRVSCAGCIFGSPDQWASLKLVNEKQFSKIAKYEKEFGITIDRKYTVKEMADHGEAYCNMKKKDIEAALSETYTGPVIVSPDKWELPAGAFGDSCGPT